MKILTQLEELANIFGNAKKTEQGYRCTCPVHNKQKYGLQIKELNGKVTFKCTQGCTHEDILQIANQIGVSQLFCYDCGSPRLCSSSKEKSGSPRHAFWREKYRKSITPDAERHLARNLLEFFSLLNEWDEASAKLTDRDRSK